MPQDKKHTISVLVENHFGVLARVSGMFSSRGYNINSLCVGETENAAISRMTVVVRGDDNVLVQIIQQLHKLVDVIEVSDLTAGSFIECELVMVRVAAKGRQRSEVVELASIFDAKVVDVGLECMTIQITGSERKVQSFIDMMNPFGIQELVRTGEISIARTAASPK